ncbi:MAG: EAL domain-containing protein [Geminicoccaceae bacterium]
MVGGLVAACLWAGFAAGGLDNGDFGQPASPLFALLVAIAISGLGGTLAIGLFWHRARRMAGVASSAEELLEEVAHAGAEFVWETDTAGRLTFLSDGFERSVGLAPAEAIGRTWLEVLGQGLVDPAQRTIAMAIAGRRSFRDVEASVVPADGQSRTLRLIGQPKHGGGGSFTGSRGVAVDISDIVKARERLGFVDRHDELTGLLNRVGCMRLLAARLRRGRRQDEQPVLLVIDIDRFRGVNEAFGAAAGDNVIRQVAERIRVCARESDTIGRIGGGEFFLLRPHALPFDPILDLTRRLEQSLEEPFSVPEESLRITCHIGLYEIAPDDREPEVCLRRAQVAISRGRRDGRSTHLFMDGMDLEARTMRRLEEELREAIAGNRLALAYQPQLALRSGRFVGAEALLRWHHHDHGFISPTRFIPVAERTGLVVPLSRWVLRQACQDSRRLGDLCISVNLSPIDLASPDFVDAVRETLARTGTDPDRLELEITEGVLIEDTESTLDVLLQLKRLGLRIALDDFGTGYAGLGYLQMFPFDKLKIDQSIIRRSGRSRHAGAIVRSVVALAHELGLVACAEGVESREQLELLRDEGCDLVQGFYAGQPMPASQMRGVVDRQTALLATEGT